MKGKKFIAIISIVCILAVMLCIPAFATVTESDGEGFSLFGGAKLPNLDGLDISLDDYPARIIIPSDDGYTLYLSSRSFDVSSAKPFVQSSGQYFYANGPAAVRYYMYNEVDSSWDFESSFSLAEMQSFPLGTTKPIWANGNLIYDSSGSIIVPASVPISLDGYNIIEWDGDPTGLVEVMEDYYLIAPYEYALDSFAVWNGNGLNVQTDYFTENSLWGIVSNGIPPLPDGIPLVGASNGEAYNGVVFDGIIAGSVSDYYVSLIAYRTVEDPPGEGGDTPDEPQPPFGAAEIYLKLHPFLLTPQLK